MARQHAKVYVQVWRDQQWRGRTALAQWLYWSLLTQPKLTLVGSLELTPARWSTLAAGLTKAQVRDALEELVAHAFVLVDETTDELLMRTFTRHDLDPNRVNVNLAKGLWGQWAAIESHRLRIAAVDGMPEPLWDRLARFAPDDAQQIRRSARMEPEPHPPPPTGTEPPGSNLLPPPSSHLPPADCHPPGAPIGNPQAATNRAGMALVRTQNHLHPGDDAA